MESKKNIHQLENLLSDTVFLININIIHIYEVLCNISTRVFIMECSNHHKHLFSQAFITCLWWKIFTYLWEHAGFSLHIIIPLWNRTELISPRSNWVCIKQTFRIPVPATFWFFPQSLNTAHAALILCDWFISLECPPCLPYCSKIEFPLFFSFSA